MGKTHHSITRVTLSPRPRERFNVEIREKGKINDESIGVFSTIVAKFKETLISRSRQFTSYEPNNPGDTYTVTESTSILGAKRIDIVEG